MNIKVEKISESKVKLLIELTKEELAPYVDSAYGLISKNIKVQGFRPGKAPKSMVEKQVGAETIQKYVLEEAIPGSYYEAVQKENIVSVGSPEVKVLKFVPTDGLTYEAIVSVIPEIKLPDFSKIKVKKETVKIDQKEIDESLDYLREMFSESKEVERAAKEKDKAEIDFEGSIKGVPFEGGSSKNHPVVIGSNTFIPGFEDELKGMKKGEEKEFNISFPKEYGAKELAGKEATFKVKLNSLQEVTLPELTDELAGKIGPFKNVAELKKDIEDKTKAEKEDRNEKALEETILKKVTEATNMEAPEVLVKEEVHRMVHEAEHNLSYSGLTLEAYLEHAKKTREEFEKELEEEAAKRVKIGLILSEVVKQNKFEAPAKEIEEEAKVLLNGVVPEKKQEAENYYNSPEGKRSIENSILAKKAMEHIKSKITFEK